MGPNQPFSIPEALWSKFREQHKNASRELRNNVSEALDNPNVLAQGILNAQERDPSPLIKRAIRWNPGQLERIGEHAESIGISTNAYIRLVVEASVRT